MSTFVQDLRYGARMLLRRPLVTAVATISLLIGIALPVVVFTLLDAVLLRPLAIADPADLVVVLEQRPTSINHNFSYPDFTDYRAGRHGFTDLFAYSPSTATLRGSDGARIVEAELVSGSYFATLGVRMSAGRPLSDTDDRPDAPPAVVVSEPLWRDVSGGAAFAPRTIVLNQREFSVVGVVNRAFGGMEVGRSVGVWAPIHAQPVLDPGPRGESLIARRTASWLTVMGRLAGGVARDQAAASLTVVDHGLAQATGRDPRQLVLVPGRQGDSMLPEVTGGPLTLLFAAAVLVLLVACANVANLLLARASEREREIAVRAALGAGRWRLARLVLTEIVMLSLVGASAAAVASRWMSTIAAGFIARFGEPASLDLGLDWRVAGFVLAIAGITTVLTGAGPVLAVLRRPSGTALADGGRGASRGPAGSRTRRALVVAQFALSLALVVAALLLATTVRNLRSVPTGFDVEHVALLSVDPSAVRLDAAATRAYIAAAVEAVRRVPGVRAAGFGRVVPLGFGGSRTTIAVPGYQPSADEDMEVNFNVISPTYFDATGITLVEGRAFNASDTGTSEPVLIVNETMASRYWRGSAVGRQVSLGDDSPPARVIGVARDVKYRALRESPRPSFYLSLSQAPARAGVLHVRTGGDPRSLLDTIQRAAIGANPSIPVTQVRTLSDQIDFNLNDERLAMVVGLTLGCAALLLAAVGLYGSLAYAVEQRTRELGVRMALGATARNVSLMVLRQGVLLTLAGALTGTGLALALARALESRLYGVHAWDPRTLAGSAVVLAAVSLAASWVPAQRAARVDPVDALRSE